MSHTQDLKSLELSFPSLLPVDFLPDVFSDLEAEPAQQPELLSFAASLALPESSINARPCRTENSSDVSRCLQ